MLDKQLKTEQILIKATPAEKELIQKEADNAGMSVSAFILLCVKNFADGIRFEKK
jgi:uncharacterized protein (DUF1778 family)